MKERLLDLCLLAYPRARREADGDFLRDLALELAGAHGVWRQAVSLLAGGFRVRLAARRRLVPVLAASLVLALAGACAITSGSRVEARDDTEEVVESPALVAAEARDPRHAPIARFLARTLPASASGTLAAARGDRLLHCRGFGLADRRTRVRTRCDTVYDTMSMTKQFTAAAILKLEMQGRLRVTDRISAHLGPVPAGKRRITIHHLLTHTSGLPEGLGGDYEPLSRTELVKRAFASRLRSRPGSVHRYSNAGYSLLAAIIEEASGLGYEPYLARHLLAPAGMTQTGYVLPRWDRRRVAMEYDARGRPRGRPFDHPWAADGPHWNLRGNGGLLSTARDMFRWHVALNGDALLSRRAKAKLLRPHVLEEPGAASAYGYGWVISGALAWHNGGNGWSYGEILRGRRSGEMVFWVTNRQRSRSGGWDLMRLAPRLTEGVARRVTP